MTARSRLGFRSESRAEIWLSTIPPPRPKSMTARVRARMSGNTALRANGRATKNIPAATTRRFPIRSATAPANTELRGYRTNRAASRRPSSTEEPPRRVRIEGKTCASTATRKIAARLRAVIMRLHSPASPATPCFSSHCASALHRSGCAWTRKRPERRLAPPGLRSPDLTVLRPRRSAAVPARPGSRGEPGVSLYRPRGLYR